MGASKSKISKLCTCNSENDYIENSNIRKCKTRNSNMSHKLSPHYDSNEFENSISTFGYESTPFSIPLDFKTIDLLMHIDDVDSISSQKLSQTSSIIINDTQEIDEKKVGDIDGQKRIETISNTSDILQLKKLIHDNYSIIHSNQSSFQSSLSLKPNIDSKANIYRDGTNTPWTDQDIDELTFEMHQQLHNLINNNIIMDVDEFECDNIIILSDDEDIPSSNLYRNESEDKWTKKSIDIQRNQMKKEILHLALIESKSSERKKEECNNNHLNVKCV